MTILVLNADHLHGTYQEKNGGNFVVPWLPQMRKVSPTAPLGTTLVNKDGVPLARALPDNRSLWLTIIELDYLQSLVDDEMITMDT